MTSAALARLFTRRLCVVAPQTLLSMFRADGAVESVRFRSMVTKKRA